MHTYIGERKAQMLVLTIFIINFDDCVLLFVYLCKCFSHFLDWPSYTSVSKMKVTHNPTWFTCIYFQTRPDQCYHAA